VKAWWLVGQGSQALVGTQRPRAQFATEAAITILRIDDMIRIQANPEEDPEG
jgi:hypothetical protein